MNTRSCAGIVLFEPDIIRLNKNISAILPQVEALVMVDNGSQNIQDVSANWKHERKIHIIYNHENMGIAKALNEICEWALEKGFKWVLTLDQDSICPENIMTEFNRYVYDENIGIICPEVVYGSEQGKVYSKYHNEYVSNCITSASFTSLKAWKEVNGFTEWLFIDYVDFDFCMRLKIQKYRILRVNTVVLQQQLGKLKVRKLLFNISVNTYNHSAFRNYYFTRNSIYYLRKYACYTKVHRGLLRLIKWELIKIIFEENRLSTIKSLCRGIIDGIKADLNNDIF